MGSEYQHYDSANLVHHRLPHAALPGPSSAPVALTVPAPLPCCFVIENASQIRPAYSGAQCGVSTGLGLIIYQGARMPIRMLGSGRKIRPQHYTGLGFLFDPPVEFAAETSSSNEIRSSNFRFGRDHANIWHRRRNFCARLQSATDSPTLFQDRPLPAWALRSAALQER